MGKNKITVHNKQRGWLQKRQPVLFTRLLLVHLRPLSFIILHTNN
jgi:hypothetical protein